MKTNKAISRLETKHEFTIEYDGALVCDGAIVVSPSHDLPKSAIAQLVNQANAMDGMALEIESLKAINEELIRTLEACKYYDINTYRKLASAAISRAREDKGKGGV